MEVLEKGHIYKEGKRVRTISGEGKRVRTISGGGWGRGRLGSDRVSSFFDPAEPI
jgi:hypothetical protein